MNSNESIKEIAFEMRDLANMYETVMLFSDRKRLRDIDSHDLKNELEPLIKKVKKGLNSALKLADTEEEKEKVSESINSSKELEEQLIHFIGGEVEVSEIASLVNHLFHQVNKLDVQYA